MNLKELNPDAGPVAAFGADLRRSREAHGWTQEDLAERMEYSSQHVSAIETGRKPPTLRFARKADVVCGTGTSTGPGVFECQWRELRHGSLLEGFPEYVRYEARAAEIRMFDAGVIPGPLQTLGYASALTDADVRRGSITPDQAEERLQFLAERQATFDREPAPVVMAVLDESCVRRPIGGPEVMDAQLAELVEFAGKPNTVLQIAPYSLGEYRPFDRLVNLLTLHDRSVISYVESQTHGSLDRELTSVLPLVRSYHQLQAESLSQAASVSLIDQLRKGAQ